MKYPEKAYWYIQDLMGKTVENPAVKLFQKRFQYYDIERDSDTGTSKFKLSKDEYVLPLDAYILFL